MKILLAKAFPRLSSVGELARELKRRGHDVHALVPAPHPDQESLRRLGIPVHVVDHSRGGRGGMSAASRSARIVGKTIGLLRSHAFDVVHLNLATSRLHGRLAALAVRPTAVVSSIRGFESRYERWTNWIDDVTVAVSHAVRRYLVAQGIPERKLVTIPNGVAVGDPEAGASDRAYLHRELGLSPDVPLVGMVAYYRSHELKGHRTFFDAARLLAPRVPAARFVSVGSSLSRNGFTQEYFERYTREIGIRDRVHFLGERHDTPRVIGSLVAHVLPSLSEGCPMVVLEAMSKGVPNVASRLDSVAEILENGLSGLLVEPGDAHALADALEHLLEDPVAARALGRAGRERLVARFSATAMAERYEGVFRAARRSDRGEAPPISAGAPTPA